MSRDLSKNPELVSVIIPNYNHARYIGDAIESVLAQDYHNYEIIVVDDGSTDNSREVVAQFGDTVKYIWQENQGLSAARNTGIAVSSGAYIGLLDADDLYEPHFMSTLVPLMKRRPEIDGVHCGYRFVDHLDNPLPQIEARSIPEGRLYEQLLGSNFLAPESMLVRRYCYDVAGNFDSSLRALEDWDMWLRISSRFNIVGTTQVLTRHRILPGSMSSDPKRMMENRFAVLDKHFGGEPLSEDGALEHVREAYGRAYLASCVEYLQVDDLEKARTSFLGMADGYPELLEQTDTFYQIGLGDQPKGYLGDFSSLNLDRSSQVLLSMLDDLFATEELADKVEEYRSVAYGHAYYALALLNFGARRFTQARRFFLAAFRHDPALAKNRQFITTWPKTWVGIKVFDHLKGGRQKLA
jgi:tetratricopeptide (TPR) repeat protein